MRLGEVVEQRAITVVFQPILALGDGEVVGHEALVRGPAGTWLEAATALFAAAREAGCDERLAILCIQETLRAFSAHGSRGLLFLNMSPRLVHRPGFDPARARRFLEGLERQGLALNVAQLVGHGTVRAAVKGRAPGVRIVAVQPAASPALAESLRVGRALLTYPAGPTLADGLAGGIGEIAFDHRDLVDEVVRVTEEEIEDAMVALLAADQVVAEASGAVGIAALRSGKVASAGRGPTVVVITGGNVDASVLARLLAARYPAAGAPR